MYTTNPSFILYTSVYKTVFSTSGSVWCGKDVYDDNISSFLAAIVWDNDKYAMYELNCYHEACVDPDKFTYSKTIQPTNITTDDAKSLKLLFEDLNKHRNIATIYTELQAAIGGS